MAGQQYAFRGWVSSLGMLCEGDGRILNVYTKKFIPLPGIKYVTLLLMVNHPKWCKNGVGGSYCVEHESLYMVD